MLSNLFTRENLELLQKKWLTWKESHPKVVKILYYYVIILFSAFSLYVILYLMVYGGVFGKLPNEYDLTHLKQPIASEVFDYQGELLGKYFIQNRTEVAYKDISPWIIAALISTEDARFYKHSGVDHRSLARVLLKSILLQDRSSGGGSTISQQLAKNLYPRENFSLLTIPVNKIREAIVARRLESLYNKEEILTMYLNTVPFGEQAYGIGTACKRFFNKTPSELTVEEAATLVGMLKATSYYNPRLHRERARDRRNVVLHQMVKYDALEANKLDSLQQLPLQIDHQKYTPSDGPAPYFRAHLAKEIKTILKDYAEKEGETYNLFTDGLRVYTSIDARLQQYADEAVRDQMEGLQAAFFRHWSGQKPWGNDLSVIERATKRSERYKALQAKGLGYEEITQNFSEPTVMQLFSYGGDVDTMMSPLDSVIYYAQFLNAGFMAMEPQSGKVRAWVGGIDYHFFQYDHVLARRQVGSTFKPIVYAAALEQGFSPCEYLENEQVTYEAYEGWTPGNANEEYGGMYSLAGGLTHSVNTITVSLLMDTGLDAVLRQAYLMGIQSELPEEPSIALGTADLSLYEMLTVYATIANGGFPRTAEYLERIEARDGTLIYEQPNFDQKEEQAVMSARTAQLMLEMLQTVVDSGTASDLRYRYGLRGPIAGKTGTTQAHADGWFIGFTPKLVAGAWVGAEDPKVRFRSLKLGQGAKTALPIWAKFMKNVLSDAELSRYHATDFSSTDVLTQSELDCPMYISEDDEKNNLFVNFNTWLKDWKNRRQMDKEEKNELEKRRRKNRGFFRKLFNNNDDRYDYLSPKERKRRLELKRNYSYQEDQD